MLLLCVTISNAQFVINGSASDLGGGEYLLTPAAGKKVGTIWSEQKVSLNNSFEVELELFFGTNNSGADGVTFSLQPKSNTVGTSGGGLGIGGITPSLITEMDTYQNGSYGDPSYDHIALTKNTVDHRANDNLVSPVRIVNGKDDVEDGAWYRFKASWDATTKVYQISVNGAVRLFYQADIVNSIFNGDPNVYWGFTGSTGGKNNLQKVRIINTSIIDLYTCTETPNDKTFCPSSGGTATVDLSIGNTQSGSTYEWYDTPDKDNLLGTGTNFTTPPISENTDFYVLATSEGGITTATVGPTDAGTLTDIWDANYLDGYHRNFTAHVPVKIISVDLNHPAWANGCSAVGSTKPAVIKIYNSGGGFVTSANITAQCGITAPVIVNFDLPAGSYTMKLQGITGGNFRLTSDGSEKSIPGVITLENNSISDQWGTTNSYSSVFFNWKIEGGAGTTECLLSVKAEKDCPPCSTYPSVNLDPNFIYCSDSDTTITVTTAASNVLWNTGETTKTITVNEGTFTVSAWDDENCKTFGGITLDKECPPNLVLVDTVTICSGLTSQITAYGMQTGIWDGTDAYTQLSDSVIEVNLQADAEFYVTNYTKLNILSDNINFEQPVIGASTYSIVDASTVLGWETTASDNKVEIWSAGFQGVQPYSGNQFMELNANMDAALYQDVSTTPGELMGVNLAHRGRQGVDVMELKAGPPGGPYQLIKSYSDGLTWGFYTDYYRVPAGQNNTRFIFETVTCNGGTCSGSGNFLDAIEFFKIREEYDTVYVKVNQSPKVDLGNDTTFCNSVDYTLDASNTGATYKWSTNETTQSININSPATYSVIVEQNGCSDQDEIVISETFCACTPPAAPSIKGTGGDTIKICQSNNTTLLSDFVIGENLLWYTTSTSNDGTATSPIVNNNIIGFTEYWVTQTVNGCESERVPIWYNVNPLPTVNLGNDTTICAGPNHVLDAKNIGATYKWNDNSTSQTLTVSTSGLYSVEVTDPYNCKAQNEINIVVDIMPSLNLGNDTLICEGSSLILDVGTSDFDILWSTSEITQTILVASTGSYSVKVSSSANCHNEDTIVVNIQNNPIVNLGSDAEICIGETHTLNAQNTGLDFLWNTNETSQTINIADQGNYSVTVTDAIGCIGTDDFNLTVHDLPTVSLGNDTTICEGSTIKLNVGEKNIAYSVEWTSPHSIFNKQTIDVDSSNVYAVKVSSSEFCYDQDTITINIQPTPIIDLGDDAEICTGEKYTLDAENTGLDFLWSTNETSQTINITTQGNYSVTVTDAIGCKGTDDFNLTVHNLPIIDVSLPTNACYEGGKITIQTIPTGGNISGTGVISNQFNPKNEGLVVDQSSYVYYDYTDANNCSNRDSTLVTLRKEPVIETNITDTTICEGYQVTLSASSNSVSLYEWFLNNKTISNNSTITANKEGQYAIIVTDDFGCWSEKFIELSIQPNPIVDLGSDITIKEGETHSLNAQNTGSSFLWNNNEDSQEIVVTEENTYSVTVTDNLGCIGTDYIYISVLMKLKIPNAFSPNGDGINDSWEIENLEQYDIKYIKVFNRWGHVVFEYWGSYFTWDGRYKGSYLPVGTYYYILALDNEKDQVITGGLTITR